MKKILFFHFESCPYCQQARRWLDELMTEHPEYQALDIQRIDEHKQPDIADRYDYWYVPTFYVDGQKIHEGACTKEIVHNVLRLGSRG